MKPSYSVVVSIFSSCECSCSNGEFIERHGIEKKPKLPKRGLTPSAV